MELLNPKQLEEVGGRGWCKCYPLSFATLPLYTNTTITDAIVCSTWCCDENKRAAGVVNWKYIPPTIIGGCILPHASTPEIDYAGEDY